MVYYCAVTALTWMALGVLSLLAHENGRLSKSERRDLYLAYGLIVVASAAELCGVALDGCEGLPAWPLMLVKFADYVLTPFAGWALAQQLGMRDRWGTALIGVLAGNVLLQLVALGGGWMVTLDAHNHYAHGPLYPVYVVTYLAVLALVAAQFVAYGRSFSRQNRASLYATVALVIAGIAMQELFGGEVRTAYLSLAFGASLLFIHNAEFSQITQDETIGEQQAQIMTDALTGAMSRYAYACRVEELADPPDVPSDLVVFSVDLNGLKDVNDNLGHDAGDELIRAAASCISKVFEGKGSCYRTGGDEFVALAQMCRAEAEETKVDLLCDAAAWSGEAVSSMSLAVGLAFAADNPELSLAELVTKADQAMYAAKEGHYRERGGGRRDEPSTGDRGV